MFGYGFLMLLLVLLSLFASVRTITLMGSKNLAEGLQACRCLGLGLVVKTAQGLSVWWLQ